MLETLSTPEGTAMTERSDDHPHVIARPPLIYLAGLLAGLGLDWLWPAAFIANAVWQYAAGAVLIAVSFAIVLPAFWRFHRAGTNIPTNLPSTTVVTSGPYRYSRNPIYLSMTVLIIGIGLTVDSAWILALLVPVLIVIRYGVIAREEAYLERKFGDEYRRYKASVRRWV